MSDEDHIKIHRFFHRKCDLTYVHTVIKVQPQYRVWPRFWQAFDFIKRRSNDDPDMVRNQLENEQAAVPGHGSVRNAGSAGCRRAVTLLFSPSSFPFTAIQPVSHFLQTHQLPLLTGAQNMHEADQGAWTGEISAAMLAETGATLVELGHSERRAAFNESDAAINRKVHSALGHACAR